jgi:PAS domain S-box-containing protein
MLGVSVLVGFYVMSQWNYLLFHSLVELLGASVAIAVFMLFWNARRSMNDNFFLFIGIACLFTGILDVMHVLTYQGTTVFPNMSGDESVQFKTAGRWVAAVSFLIAPLFLRRRLKPVAVLSTYSAIVLVVSYLAFFGVLPDFYLPGKGLTFIEHVSRSVSGIVFFMAAGLLALRRSELDDNVFRLLFAALLVSAVSECASAISQDFQGFVTVVAHLSEVVSFYLIYKAFVVEGLTNPLSLFFQKQRQSDGKYRTLFESSRDALMTLEPPSWKFTSGNPATVEMFRLKDAEQLTTLEPWVISPELQPDGRNSIEKAKEMITTAVREGSHFFEWTHRRLDGSTFPATVLLTRMEQFGAVFVQCTIRDSSDQKRAEEVLRRHAAALQQEYDSLQAVFDAAQVGFLLVNDRNEVVRVNEMLARIVGKNPASMLGHMPGDGMGCLNAVMSLEGCGNGEACAECPIRSSIARALQSGASSRGIEVSYNLQVGGRASVFCFLVSAAPVLVNGAPHALLAITDINDRKQAEDQALRYATELEAVNILLEEAKSEAETANRVKSEFLANMSHEIRTPMTAILGYADILVENVSDRQGIEAADTIRRNGAYLLDIINNILDLSKIEAGKMEVERIAHSPVGTVAEVASLMRVRAEAKKLKIATEFRGPIPETIQTDPIRLRQILFNLVGNAVKFTEFGEIRIVTSLRREEGKRPLLQFDVIDTGIGMSPEQIAKLFRPFSQADASTSRRFGGSGLGLTISRRLANLLGGDICLRSQPGRASTFSVTIDPGPLDGVPMLHNPSEAASDGVGRRKQPHGEAPRLEGRVLLAEDGPDNQRLIAFLLRKAGAEVAIVENGQAAVDAVVAGQSSADETESDCRRPFDVILMDMQMPVLDGYSATRRLRSMGYGGPIVALTAHAMIQDRQKCLDAGCDDYLAKPVDRLVLLETVARHLSANYAQASAAGE